MAIREQGRGAPVPAPAPAARAPGRLRRRIVLGIGILILLLVLAVAGLVTWLIYHPLPTTQGSLSLPGLSAPVTVVRDSAGIPHITAANSADLFRAQGYVTAQDRLFEMDFYRRVASGRLSEVLGPTTLANDQFIRTVGWYHTAEQEWAQLAPADRAPLEDYAAGVNAFLDSHQDSLPIEFTILGYKPAHWSPVDTLAFGKVMAWDLSENVFIELTNADLQAKIGAARAAELLPAYPDGATTITQQSALPGNPNGHLADLQWSGVFARGAALGVVGSNNWVLDGTRTADGHALLANDPHLAVQNPSIWYAVQLRAADGSMDAEGVTFAGVPGIVVGHNAHISWGVTNLGPDTQDLYLETLDPQGHPGQYEYKGQWRPLGVLTETIGVKGADPVTLTVQSTVHGPLLNSAWSDLKGPTAFAWTALQPGSPLPAVLGVDRASNWTEFHAALANWTTPGQNFVYADDQGNIGYQATGQWPIRKQGNGLVPVDGASGDYDWTGFVPYDKMPSVYNPPEHYIVTANNRVVGPSYPYLVTGWWYPWYRAERITQMIQATPKASIDDVKTMQHDTHDLLAAKIAPYLAALTGGDAPTQQAAGLFRAWDGNMAADSAAAAVYEVTYQQILTNTFADELGGSLAQEYFDNLWSAAGEHLDAMVGDPTNAWWDDTSTPAHETRDDILRKSLSAAVQILTAQQGGDMSKWTWGAMHQITFAHKLGVVTPLNLLLNLGPYPTGGDQYTVNVGGFTITPDAPNTFDQDNHASMRLIMDPGDWTRTQLVFAPGELGQPGSPHWGDQVPAWLDNGYNTLAWTADQIQQAAQGTLTLNP